MHEYSLIGNLVDLLEELATKEKWPSPSKVFLRVGALRQVVPEIMVSCYEIYTEGTLFQGSSLEMEIAPIVWQCENCGFSWVEENGRQSCSKCGSSKAKLLGGEELEIISVEVRENAKNCKNTALNSGKR